MKTKALTLVAVLVMLGCSEASAAPLRLRVMDQTGAAFPDVLVIVKSLAGKGEIFRALTDHAGGVPERELPGGLYRAIATCPYGICETKVSEFLVGDTPVELEVKVDVSPTRGNVAMVGPSNRLKLEVVDTQGRPAVSAEVLVRDSNAEFEQWYKTNGEGEADVEPRGTTTTFVVLYNRTLTTETISSEAIQKLRSEGKKIVIRLK
jgi:hypothetical protein